KHRIRLYPPPQDRALRPDRQPNRRESTAMMTKTGGLYFDCGKLEPRERYKLLTGLVVPRPIALVTTVSRAGVVNTAPYSFFNMFSENPAVVVIGIDSRPDGSMKDSAKNARDTGVFVVNLVDEGLAAAMNDCAVDFPPETSETGILG